MPRTTVVLADDHPLVRQGLRSLLEAEADCTILGEEADGLKVVDLVERLRPDLLLLDLRLPGQGGLEVMRQLLRRGGKTRVIVLSMHAGEPLVRDALRLGAHGYVLKDAPPGEVVEAVRAVGAGRRYLSRSLAERAIDAYAAQAAAPPDDPYESLTTRERQVLQLAAESHTLAEIATRLGISPRTVESHREHLMQKLGLHSQTDLIRYAVRRGIVPLED